MHCITYRITCPPLIALHSPVSHIPIDAQGNNSLSCSLWWLWHKTQKMCALARASRTTCLHWNRCLYLGFAAAHEETELTSCLEPTGATRKQSSLKVHYYVFNSCWQNNRHTLLYSPLSFISSSQWWVFQVPVYWWQSCWFYGCTGPLQWLQTHDTHYSRASFQLLGKIEVWKTAACSVDHKVFSSSLWLLVACFCSAHLTYGELYTETGRRGLRLSLCFALTCDEFSIWSVCCDLCRSESLSSISERPQAS